MTTNFDNTDKDKKTHISKVYGCDEIIEESISRKEYINKLLIDLANYTIDNYKYVITTIFIIPIIIKLIIEL